MTHTNARFPICQRVMCQQANDTYVGPYCKKCRVFFANQGKRLNSNADHTGPRIRTSTVKEPVS